MGYNTLFDGQVAVEPPLNAAEIAYLRAFARTWHGEAPDDPYFTAPEPDGAATARLIPFKPVVAVGQPGEVCHWIPTADGAALVWNGCGQFDEATAWMRYLIDHFLTGRAGAFGADERSAGFTFDHVCDGRIDAQGEDPADTWSLLVHRNEVRGLSVHSHPTASADLPVSPLVRSKQDLR